MCGEVLEGHSVGILCISIGKAVIINVPTYTMGSSIHTRHSQGRGPVADQGSAMVDGALSN